MKRGLSVHDKDALHTFMAESLWYLGHVVVSVGIRK